MRLGLNQPLMESIKEQGFEEPTEIQEKAIPLVLQGKDVIGGSATGSGKTLVFGAAIIQRLDIRNGVQTLVLTPTRELCLQVSLALKGFSKFRPMEVVSIYGGVGIEPQIQRLKHADVVVGTPGRILDHLERETLKLNNIKILVLDEADRMLDMGFIDDVEKIIRACPKSRQTMLFSATIYPELANIAQQYMNSPIKISAEQYVDPRKMAQYYYDIPYDLKFSLLAHLLKNESAGLVMVFCNTRHGVDFVANNLNGAGINALAIHGGLSQDKRSKTMADFHSQRINVLVCTDVAARGLDIPGVSHVYNYDAPDDAREYIHRIGRTARAGAEGKVINLIAPNDHDNFSRVLEDNELKVTKVERPYIQRIEFQRMERRGGFRGNRGGRGGSSGGQREGRPRYRR